MMWELCGRDSEFGRIILRNYILETIKLRPINFVSDPEGVLSVVHDLLRRTHGKTYLVSGTDFSILIPQMFTLLTA